MSFLLRAALVIGALSYLAATRDQPAATASGPAAPAIVAARDAAPTMGSTLLATVGSTSAALRDMPPEARQRLAQEAMAELGRHLGPAGASRDTLADTDRKAAWRGAESR